MPVLTFSWSTAFVLHVSLAMTAQGGGKYDFSGVLQRLVLLPVIGAMHSCDICTSARLNRHSN